MKHTGTAEDTRPQEGRSPFKVLQRLNRRVCPHTSGARRIAPVCGQTRLDPQARNLTVVTA